MIQQTGTRGAQTHPLLVCQLLHGGLPFVIVPRGGNVNIRTSLEDSSVDVATDCQLYDEEREDVFWRV